MMHDILQRLYPRSFRRQWGEELARVREESLAVARGQGRIAALCAHVWLLLDALRALPAAWHDAMRQREHPRQARSRPARSAGRWMEGLGQDVAHSLRSLRRSPAFAVATVVTLALAAGASTAVFGILDTYLRRPLPFPGADRLVFIEPHGPETSGTARPGPSLAEVDWTAASEVFETVATWDLDGFTIAGGQYAENVTGAWVSPGFFSALGVRPAIGRGFAVGEYGEPASVALISHGLWVRRYQGDRGVVGSTVTMHSTDRPGAATAVTIVGVLPRDFWPLHWRESDVLRPLPPDVHAMPSLAQLRSGASREVTQRQLETTVRGQLEGGVDPAWSLRLVPILDRHSERARPALRVLLASALFVLLAACGSVAGALVSRMAARYRELVIRRAIGGSRARVMRQLVTEGAVLATLAGLLGMGIAALLLQGTGALVERQLGTRVPGGSSALHPTASLVLLSLAASTLVGVVLGLVPALSFLRLDRRATASSLLATGRSAAGRHGAAAVRRALIVGQVAVAMVLLFGAGLMVRTLLNMQTLQLGFRADGVLKARILLPAAQYPDSNARRRLVTRLLASATATEGVQSAAVAYPGPFEGLRGFPVLAEGAGLDDESAPRANVYTVSEGHFETMGVQLRAGRAFTAMDDPAAPLVVVVSERLARRLARDADVIGRRIRVRVPQAANYEDRDDRPWRTIVGVVTDTEKDFAEEELADLYVPYAQNPRALVSLLVRTDREVATMVEPLRAAAARVDEGLALSAVTSLTDAVADRGGQRRGMAALLAAFAVFALGLAALALYASLSYSVTQREPELAVRIAIGADPRAIMGLVVSEGVATAAIGVLVGVAGSLAFGRVLANQVYGVGPRDPATLAAIAVVLVLTVIVACAMPAHRASRTDPGLALRE